MSRKKIGLIALFSLTAILSLVTALGAITSYNFTGKVLPRTFVAGADIGNLTYAQAKRPIQEKAVELIELKVSFTLNDKSANASLDELGIKLDEESILTQVARPINPFDWLSPKYWRTMFSKKELAFSYTADPSLLKKKVETILGVTTAAADAQISFNNGQLVVHEAQRGVSVSESAIDQAIKTTLATGSPNKITLEYTESSPNITTAIATQTKTELEQSLTSIQLIFEDQIFTIGPSAQYSFLDFSTINNRISYKVSENKIRNYLNTNVAAKINIKMLPKTTQSDTQQVTQEGRDGREIDTGKLAKDITRTISTEREQRRDTSGATISTEREQRRDTSGATITELTDTSNSTIVISARTIAFTEKTIYPDYVAGLFPGLYIDINLTKQRLFIITGETKQAEYLISSGKRGTPTPSGVFYIKNKIPLAQSRLFPGIWMEKWNALATSPDGSGYKGYGVHRVPCFDPQCNSREPASHLGRPVSHGCVRIEDAGADWVYDNAPVGTPVNIHT